MRKVFMTNVLMATVLGIATAFANRYRFLALSFTILQLDKCERFVQAHLHPS